MSESMVAESVGCIGTKIPLVTGGYLDLAAPDPNLITIRAIACGISNACRYAGQMESFYSVAEHSVACCIQANTDCLTTEAQIAVLMHDAAEAFIGDVTRPLKLLLPEFRPIEHRMLNAIGKRFGIDFKKHWDVIREIDNAILFAEKRWRFPDETLEWHGESGAREVHFAPRCLSPNIARAEFLSLCASYGIQ